VPLRRRGHRWSLAAVVVAGTLLLWAAPAHAGGVLRGLCEPGMVESWRDGGPAVIEEFQNDLGADVVRVNFCWNDAEESPGVYEQDYIGRAVSAVREIRARGMQALVVVWEPPTWASDRSLWGRPAPQDTAGVYHSYYPPALDSLDELEVFMRYFSSLLQGEVLAYSCWVEPNLWTYMYPQRTASAPDFAVRRYARILEAFSKGVRAGDPQAQVVAGETCPTGDNTRLSTSPQRFARRLAALGGGAHFDVYAHHPYPTGGNARIAPGALPRDPSHTVWLGNIDTLLDVFPGKPFYLTEFAYATAPSMLFGVWVSQSLQASYLKAAFRLAAKHDQVKMLVWFPRTDWAANGTYHDVMGHYCGLVRLDGRRKRAYFAFAGGNQLTLADLGSVTRGGALTLRGALTSARLGALGGKELVVLAHRPHRPWVVVAKTRSQFDGSYRLTVRPYASATWKVRWSGVVTSRQQWVPVR
jgi:hypothetical protein